MGDVLLFGGGSGCGGGLREKPISWEAYNTMTPEERNNPNIIWVITNIDHTDFTETYGANCVTKSICWEAYCKLDDFQKNDNGIVWIISDKSQEELSLLLTNTNPETVYYDVNGDPVTIDDFSKVDMRLDKNSTRPVANIIIATMYEELVGLNKSLVDILESYIEDNNIDLGKYKEGIDKSISNLNSTTGNLNRRVTNLEENMGGLKFSINEQGGLRITFNDEEGGE